MFPKILASLVLLACVVMALRMALPARHTAWMDRLWHGTLQSARRTWQRLRSWRRDQQLKKSAEAEAEAAIRKARAGSRMVEGEWDGNVYRPKSFGDAKQQRDKRNLH